MDEETETPTATTEEAEPANTVEIPAEIEDAQVHTATTPLATLNAKLDMLLAAQGLTYKEQ